MSKLRYLKSIFANSIVNAGFKEGDWGFMDDASYEDLHYTWIQEGPPQSGKYFIPPNSPDPNTNSP